MAEFKVKYRTRQRLQRAIEQTIQRLELVDSYTMKNSVRISAVTGDFQEMIVTINAIYYYMFQDLGATGAGAGRNVDIRPMDITQKAFQTNQGKQFLIELNQAYMDWFVKQPGFNILDPNSLTFNPTMRIQYNLYGDPSGKWNGIFNPPQALRVQWQPA